MTRKRKKILSAAIAGVMAAVLLISNLMNLELTVEASDKMMPGIETIVNGNTLKVLEIVSEESKAEIGAYVSGQEPWLKLYKEKVRDAGGNDVYEKRSFSTLEEGLKSLPSEHAVLAPGETSADVRKAFAEGTATYEENGNTVPQFHKFSDLASDDIDKAPFGFEKYEETYFPAKPQDYTKLELDRVQEVELKGSYEPVTNGTGDYTEDERYFYPVADKNPAEQAKAEYKENIMGFTFQEQGADKPYDLTFDPVLKADIASGGALDALYDYENGGYGYYENIYAYLNLNDPEAVVKLQDGDAIYTVIPTPLPSGLIEYSRELRVAEAVGKALVKDVWNNVVPANFDENTNNFRNLTYKDVLDIIAATELVIQAGEGDGGEPDVPSDTYPDGSIVQDSDGVCQYYVWQRNPDGTPTLDTDKKVIYDKKEMLYVEGKQMVSKDSVTTEAYDGYYYLVKDVEFVCFKDPQGTYLFEGTYSAILPLGGEEFVKVPMGTGTFYASDPTYTLTPGTGTHTFVPDSNGTVNLVPIHSIYYKGGLKNYDWFKRHILHMDPGDGSGETQAGTEEAKLAMEQFAAFQITVDTMTKEQLTEAATELWNNDTSGNKPQTFDESMYLKQLLQNYQLVLAGGEVEPVQAVALLAGVVNKSLSVIINSDTVLDAKEPGLSQLAGWLTYKDKGTTFSGLVGTNGEYPKADMLEAKLNSADGLLELKKASHYVLENVYFFSGVDKTGTEQGKTTNKFISGQLYTKFLDTLSQTGFQEISEYIKTENKLREIENAGKTLAEAYEMLEETLSQARAVEYILNFSYKRNLGSKDVFNVLDLEPADKGTEETLTKDEVRSWLGPLDDKDNIPWDDKKEDWFNHTFIFNEETTLSGFTVKRESGLYSGDVTLTISVVDMNGKSKVYDKVTLNFGQGDSPHTVEFKEKVKVKQINFEQNVLGSNIKLNYSLFDKTVVNIDRMSTSEFVGKIGDLNTQYDMIYMGSDTSNQTYFPNTEEIPASNSQNTSESPDRIKDKEYPKYTESVMDGMVYVHVGDAVIDNNAIKRVGLMEDDYAPADMVNGNGKRYLYATDMFNLRSYYDNAAKMYKQNTETYAVTDGAITRDVEVGNLGVFRKSGNDITPILANKLVDFARSGYPIITEDDIYIVSGAPDKPKVKEPNALVIDNTSCIYDFLDRIKSLDNVLTKGELKANATAIIFNVNLPKPSLDFGPNNSGMPPIYTETDKQYISTADKSLQYTFQIKDEAIISHEGQTYHCQLFVDLNTDGNYADEEEVDDIVIRDEYNNLIPKDGNGQYALKVNTTYKVSRVLPSAYREIINWKLQVTNNSNPYIRTSESGLSKMKQNDKVEVKVLQIMMEEFSTWDLTTSGPNVDTDFTDLLDGVDEFDFKVESITVPEYVEFYENGKSIFNGILSGQDNPEPDMLILGFSDLYQNIDNTYGAVDDILTFINNGKSVLFAHDNISFINYTSDEIDMTGTISENGIQTDEKNVPHKIDGIKNNKPFKIDNWGYNINKILRQVLGMDRFGITYPDTKDILKQNRILTQGDTDWQTVEDKTQDMAYVAGSKDQTVGLQTYPETHGYNNILLEQGEHTDIETTEITQMNDGVITKYPYELDPTFKVAPTHAQYYQLSLEQDHNGDKESDIVVWYALGGDKYPHNDARNNYYIYSNGNVMYTGVGHKEGMTEMEKKLFVNTIVAAYHSTVRQPAINFIENADYNSDKKQYEYYSTDINKDIDDNIIDKKQDIYFRVFDYNLKKSDIDDTQKLDINFYVKTENGKGQFSWNMITNSNQSGPDNTELNYDPLPDTAYNLVGNIPEPGKVHSGEVYKMEFNDISTLLRSGGYKDTRELYATVSGKSLTYGKLVELFGHDKLTFRKQQLTNLD